MEKPKTRLKKRAIKRLVEELIDVLNAFGWYGISGGEVEPTHEDQANLPLVHQGLAAQPPVGEAEGVEHPEEQADEDEEDYDDYMEPTDADPWDIHTAVDEAVSALLRDETIPDLTASDGPPSLSRVFELLFGDGHDMTQQIEYFEELVAGYEDKVMKDDLREAYQVLLVVVQNLKRLVRWQD